MTRPFASVALLLLPWMSALIAPSGFGQSQYQATVLADHPVAYYRLGEAPGTTVAADSSGNANNGTYENGAELGVPGLIIDPANTAVNFASGDVVIPDAADLDLVGAPFTIEAWINGTSLNTQARVFDKTIAGTGSGYGVDLANNNIRLLGCTSFDPLLTLADGTTYHIVGVSDGAGTGSVYVNGTLVMSGPYNSCSPYNGPAHIAVANDLAAHFDGVIDEVAVYNYALSAQRILAHYETGVSYLVLAPRSRTFPAQPVGSTSAPMYVKVTNIGPASVGFSVIKATGDFSIKGNNCGTGLATGTSCYIGVEFKPTATGSLTGYLAIKSNAPGSPQYVRLSGTGE